MADDTTTAKVKTAIGSLLDLIAIPFVWAWGFVPAYMRKWIATLLVLLMIGGGCLWFSRSVLEWKLPEWHADKCPQPVALLDPKDLRTTEIATRVVTPESISVAAAAPEPIPPPKPPKKKKKIKPEPTLLEQIQSWAK